ncbi:MAG TPA: undecaprenyl/decaprenyl-phosphate alpha-N-acetylglucosaminyl 1-phosphate transferase [Acidimicrobiales bacterium]|jgi:UDP-GlcNAc:undecaprenyl-phosphate GlcNAc-1-phosphate transferase|nr:undecaprenyl/decaprenyl-phosphate alpha-N-acetylglucosaminyl 1-phosphate transferase [Acidimicrobiales bacterium]
MPWYAWYAVVLAVAAAVTAASAWPASWFARKVGYVAIPGDRMVHTRTTPYGGGPAMFLGFLVAMMVAASIHSLRPIFSGSSEPLGVVLAAAAIFGVGLIDDARDMSAPAKIAGQVLAASILYFLGVTLYWFKVPLGGVVSLTPGITPLIMALWVIALTNAVNLIDGLDGLAAGVVAIGGGALAVYGLRLIEVGVLTKTNIGPLIAVIACGVCLGFLPFNFHPAKMFMGDSGALLLGLLMSAATMVIGGRIPPSSPTTGFTFFFFAPLLIPFFILGVPILDMAFAFVRRTARGTGFHTPDKDHIHHRLLRLGHGHRRSVVILWAWTAILSGFILFPLFVKAVNAFIPLGVALLAVALVTWFHPDLRRRTAVAPLDVAAPPPGPRRNGGRSRDGARDLTGEVSDGRTRGDLKDLNGDRSATNGAARRRIDGRETRGGARGSSSGLPSDRFADRRDRMG